MSTPLSHATQDIAVLPVESTTEYAFFKLEKRNRPIDDDHLERLYDAVAAKNLLREFPIVVNQDGVVLDGQHRLKVAEALGVPIYYIVSDIAVLDDIPKTTAATKRWTISDWLHTWVVDGRQEYIKLAKYCRDYPFVPLNAAISMCHYGDRGGMHVSFKNGTYQCNDLEFGIEAAKAIKDFSPYFKWYREVPFIFSVAMLLEHPFYDHERMMSKLPQTPHPLTRRARMADYLEQFTQIYYWRTPLEGRKAFAPLPSASKSRREDRRNRNAKMRLDQ